MKAISGAVLLYLLSVAAARAGGSEHKNECKAFSEKPFTKSDYALLPFRAIPWAVYYAVRLPGRIIEYALYGQTGERMAGIPDVAPTLH